MAEPRLRRKKNLIRSQSEMTGNQTKKLEQQSRPMLKATSVNCIYNTLNQEHLSPTPSGRPRSWTWHGGAFESVEDKGTFSLEDSTCGQEASLNVYSSDENLQDAGSHVLSSDQKIEKQAIKDIISDVLVTEFLNRKYDEAVAVEQCVLVCQRIQAAVKSMLGDHTKVVATVHTGEQRGQAVEISCQCLWDPENDNLVTVSFQDSSLFAICTVFIVQ